MGVQISHVYLDNEPWMFDPVAQQFVGYDDRTQILGSDDAKRQDRHVASLMIVTIKGGAYYFDERLREMRRVGNPASVLTFEQYDRLPENERVLAIPIGDDFRDAMAREGKQWAAVRQRERAI